MNNKEKTDIITEALLLRHDKLSKDEIIKKKYLVELSSLLVPDNIHDESIIYAVGEKFSALDEKLSALLTDSDRAFLIWEATRRILKKARIDDISLFSIRKPTQIYYLKNNFSDNVFQRFSKSFGKSEQHYTGSFEEAAQGVFYSENSACILPYETENGFPMSGIISLIDKYELKKLAFCRESTGESLTKFGLFAKGCMYGKEQNMIDFSIYDCGVTEYKKILNAAEVFGIGNADIAIREIFPAGERKTLFTMKAESEKRLATIIYLILERFRYDISGVYREI